MFVQTSKTSILFATRLGGNGVQCLKRFTAIEPFHTSTKVENYAAAAPLPIPNNVDVTETTRFSPHRSRDISANVVLAQAPVSTIDITTDNTLTAAQASINQDPHVQSYDCFGVVSLNSVMQSNVPEPFGGMHKFSHLNMPGGQWSQDNKFMSQNLHSSHYRALRDSTRADWAAYDQNAIINKGHFVRRNYSTQQNTDKAQTAATAAAEETTAPTPTGAPIVLSKKEQLKQAFKEYGTTIIVFHVGISLISLGGFYTLVSSGINFMPVMEFLGIASSAFADKVATGSTFVVAYAVHKVFAPLRISITLGSAPFIVRYLRTKGFLKPKAKTTIR